MSYPTKCNLRSISTELDDEELAEAQEMFAMLLGSEAFLSLVSGYVTGDRAELLMRYLEALNSQSPL